MRKLELLAPAKNLACGMAAVDCGADAVYIGAPKFGARAAAGNSIEDIERLTKYAHRFGAKVFVTLNTILYDHELPEARSTLLYLYRAGVDAVLVQDMAAPLLLPPMGGRDGYSRPLVFHASTQTDNRSKEQVLWLASQGFKRVVLARELSLEEISEIYNSTRLTNNTPSPVGEGRGGVEVGVEGPELEAFVHGALCVSYSGACYASQHCFGRSANRGECAQFCRMKFDLVDSDGKEIVHQRFLLSLKDLCQIDRLEELAEAGVVSFKIEGRLKDESYVRNVVAAYSEALNRLCEKYPERYERASKGRVHYAFSPNLKKTFNRGYTHYFLDGRVADIFSPDTPKAMGEYVGKVKEIRGNSFNVAGTASFVNGDGLCFINARKELEGFRVNRVEGNRLFLLRLPDGLRPGVALYRNNDVAFEKELARQGTERKLPISLRFGLTATGFALSAQGDGVEVGSTAEESGGVVTVEVSFDHQPAQKPQAENIRKQLSKWGGTIYEAERVDIDEEAAQCFVPSSVLSSLRQELCEKLESYTKAHEVSPEIANIPTLECEVTEGDVLAGQSILPPEAKNVANAEAEKFYKSLGVETIIRAYETHPEDFPLPLMQCRHCLKFSLGYCQKRGGRKADFKEPLFLRLADGRRFRLQFDCKTCQMNVYAE